MAVIKNPASTARGSSGQNRVSIVKEKIKTLVQASFAGTLGTEKDIVNIVSALIFFESTFNTNAVGLVVSSSEGTAGGAYMKSSVIQKVLSDGTQTEKARVQYGLQAMGLMQVMGHYFVKGAGPTGVSELQRLRADLASALTVDPGGDIPAAVLGDGNMDKAITAGLIILESKYKNVRFNSPGWQAGGDKFARIFPNRISAAVAAYLGLGKQDRNGTTPEAYSASIVGGQAYASANGAYPAIRQSDFRDSVMVASGPTTNGVARAKISTPGC